MLHALCFASRGIEEQNQNCRPLGSVLLFRGVRVLWSAGGLGCANAWGGSGQVAVPLPILRLELCLSAKGFS